MNKSWNNKFIEKSKNISVSFLGWNYAFNYDNRYFSKIIKKRAKKNYEYKIEPKYLKTELLELENLNKNTSLQLKPIKKSEIAIIGCGPVGMSASLWLKKKYPNIDISIYENRIDLKSNKIKPFTRRWLTFINMDLLEPILDVKDISIIKKIGLKNYIGIDIRNLEYSLLRSINKHGINICPLNKEIPKPKIIIDASGGKFIKHKQSAVKKKFIMNRKLGIYKTQFGQKLSDTDGFNQIEIVDFGSIIKPIWNGSPLQIPFLKINYLPPEIKEDFIYFSNELNNNYGIFYWNGVMREDLNHSLLFLSILEDEFNSIDELINSPMRLDQAWDNDKFRTRIPKRLSILFEWLLNRLEPENMCYLEPLFLWEPFLCLRQKQNIQGDIEYLNIGDSHFIGNPKVGNGLSYHLTELKEVFSNQVKI